MKPTTGMTLLTTVSSAFHAKVLAARLGAEGIPTQLRGGVDGIYPIFAEAYVLVPRGQLEMAREILLADAVDALFDEAHELPDTDGHGSRGSERSHPRSGRRRALAVVAVAIAAMMVLVGFFAAARAF
jgi:hypothetical protein